VETLGLRCDVRDVQVITDCAAETLGHMPDIGGLVHCAGVVDQEGLDGLTEESWDCGIAVHLRALPFLIKAFLPAMARRLLSPPHRSTRRSAMRSTLSTRLARVACCRWSALWGTGWRRMASALIRFRLARL
jgi:NAD(P)-dependent dehydrogenase (short-subunit alcohol dehydrogenase family)